MSTKQLRISDAAQIKSRLATLVGKTVNVVLRNNMAQTGVLEVVTGSTVTFRNMRLKKVEFPIDQITEIYFDTIV